MRIEITQKLLGTFGDNTLRGCMAIQEPSVAFSDIEEVELVFIEPSAGRSVKDGPELFLIPEYVPTLLVRQVLDLVTHGIKVRVFRRGL
jgi:hypothetical protein